VVAVRELGVAEQRYQAVLAVIEDGLSVTDVAAKVGVSRQSLHAWLVRYEQRGLDGLGDRSHRPRSCPHQMSAAVEVRLTELRGLHPGWGAERLRYRLEKEGVDPLPSRAAIGRALRRLGLSKARGRRPERRTYQRWERGRAMELWQIDVMGGVLVDDGKGGVSELKAVTGIDDHSRFCVMVGLVERATSRPVCAVFAQAMRVHGVPEEVLTDNGKVFTGKHSSRPMEVLFDRVCRENGIKHRLTAPRSPTTTGKIERFHGTLRRELLDGVDGPRVFASKAEAQAAVDAWVVEYNTDRPHQSIGRAVPAERFTRHRVETVEPAAAQALPLRLTSLAPDRDGQDWVSRRVGANGVICVAWQQVSVGKHRGGEVVDVHVSDRLLEVWSGNDLIRTIVRDNERPVRKRRASKPANP
jgi:transposase InsO family protein